MFTVPFLSLSFLCLLSNVSNYSPLSHLSNSVGNGNGEDCSFTLAWVLEIACFRLKIARFCLKIACMGLGFRSLEERSFVAWHN